MNPESSTVPLHRCANVNRAFFFARESRFNDTPSRDNVNGCAPGEGFGLSFLLLPANRFGCAPTPIPKRGTSRCSSPVTKAWRAVAARGSGALAHARESARLSLSFPATSGSTRHNPVRFDPVQIGALGGGVLQTHQGRR
jgi:hypothetical protein